MKFNKKFFVFLISSIIIYATFLIVSDLNKLSENIVDFKIEFLPLILSLVSAGWVALYFRWVLLLKNLKYSLPHKENFPIFLSGFALSVTPGKVGELLKSQLLKEKFDLPIKISAPVILIERFYNAIGIIIISIFGILVFDFSGIIILITTCLLILIFFILRSERLFHIFIQKISKISFLSKFSNSFMNSYDVIKESTRPKIFIISSILSAIYWIFESIAVYFILKSFGIDLLSIFDVIPTYATSIILGGLVQIESACSTLTILDIKAEPPRWMLNQLVQSITSIMWVLLCSSSSDTNTISRAASGRSHVVA